MKTLLLWDIDGTLIDSGGAGDRALRTALEREFGIVDSLEWLELAGRTDVWIAQQMLQRFGIEPSQANVFRLLDAYLDQVRHQMSNPRARVLPGVQSILEAAQSHGAVAQGLLTGNLVRGAKIKLGHFDLWKYFPFGAFGDDSSLRNELGPHAVRRAAEHHRIPFLPDRVFVIGDTPHDIACGKIIGARTIAVATGRYDRAALEAHHPNAVFGDLSNREAVWEVFGFDD